MISRRSLLLAALASSQMQGFATDLSRAMQSVEDEIPKASADPDRPVYHFHPPADWNNDPNGTIFYRGWHHLFYQLNPFGSKWGNMHWGHARSRDLVNWEHLPIALAPSEGKGETAVFSGAAALNGHGQVRLLYTSIGNRSPEQWMAEPEDEELLTWKKSARNPILTTAAHGHSEIFDWRDPFLFTDNGTTYMVCGGNTTDQKRGGGGQVELYRANNSALTAWTYLGPVFQCKDRDVINIECPNLFKLADKWVLIVSPQKPCEYYVGSLDLQRAKFTPERHGVLDPGNAYASNISRDDAGRTILWLWGRTETPLSEGWNGVMTLPRILSIAPDGFLRQQPAAEFQKLRGEHITLNPLALQSAPTLLNGIRGDCMELNVELTLGKASSLRLDLRCSNSGKAGASISIDSEGLLRASGATTLVGKKDRQRLRIFLDKRVFEIYVNDGETALYGLIDAAPDDLAVNASAQGGDSGAAISSLEAWRLQPAKFDLSRFHL